MSIIKELRIGNLVQTKNGLFPDNPAKVKWAVTEEDLVQIIESKNQDRYEPVVITEELLIKCGGVNIGVNETHSGWNIKDLIVMLLNDCVRIDLGQVEVSINYIHQLQNLYFALYNIELEIDI